MTLRLQGWPDGRGGTVDVEVPPGGCGTLAVADPAALVRGVAGLAVPPGGAGAVVLGGTVLTAASPGRRWRAGLATVLSDLPGDGGLRVLDVVLLGDRLPRRLRTAAVALGARRARSQAADAEAAARALAGRIGLSPWLGATLAAAPAEVRAATDLARALLPAPGGLVWRRPEWLLRSQARVLAETVGEEAARLGIAVVEVREG